MLTFSYPVYVRYTFTTETNECERRIVIFCFYFCFAN